MKTKKHTTGLSTLLRITITIAICFLIGCAAEEKKQSTVTVNNENELNGEKIRRDLYSFADMSTLEVASVASEIARNDPTGKTQESALLWKMRVAMGMQNIVRDPDPRIALVGTWVVSLQQLQFFTDGAGKNFFGDQTPKAIKVAETMIVDIEKIAKRHIPLDAFQAAKKDIATLARERPISSQSGVTRLYTGDISQTIKKTDVGDILTLPLAPLTGFKGVGDTAAAVDRIGVVLGVIAEIIEEFPRMSRWQFEALLIRLETSKTMEEIKSTISKVEQHTSILEEDFDRIVNFAESIPDEVTAQRIAILQDLDNKIDTIEKKLAGQRTEFQKFFTNERDIAMKITEERILNVVANIFIKLIILFVIIIAGIFLFRYLPKPAKRINLS